MFGARALSLSRAASRCQLTPRPTICVCAAAAGRPASPPPQQVQPWIEYETYSMRLLNNVIHDVWGAGLGVNGGYQILMAHNSLYK